MWRLIGGGVLALAAAVLGLGIYLSDKIYLRDNHRAIPAAEFDRLSGPDDLREDVTALVSTLRKIHPDFEGVGGAAFEARAQELARSFDRPVTRMEAYRLLAPLNQFLRDGHTYLRPPDEERLAYQAEGGLYPPFTVNIEGPEISVARPLSASGEATTGARIEAINGASGKALAEFALASTSGESLALREAYAEKNFHRDAWAYGIESPFVIRMEQDGRPVVVREAGISHREFVAKRGAKASSNSFAMLDDGIGLLTFNRMPAPDAEFRRFLASSFAALKESGAGALIIDIRENGGGDSRAADALMAYLSKDRLPAIAHVDVKVTEEIKAYYRTLLPKGFEWIPLHRLVPLLRRIENQTPGESFRFYPAPREPSPRRKRPDFAFDGNLYILIGPRTYSSAVIFAAPLKHFGRATFVGKETGEPLIFFGENYYFDLPHTRLQAQVSHKRFVMVGAMDASTGVIPDILAPKDALAATLEAIAASR